MPTLNETTATQIIGPALPDFSGVNGYPLSRIKKEVLFAIAQRTGELTGMDTPLVEDWINDAYQQILGMIDTPRLAFSIQVTLPASVSTLGLPPSVREVVSINTIKEGLLTPMHKSIDIEYWRSLETNQDLDNALLNYYLHFSTNQILLQFHPQSTDTTLLVDGFVEAPPLTNPEQCPVLPDALCLGLIDLAISIALRRFGEYTYAGVQNNAALAIIRSHIDEKSKARRGTIAAVTRPRTLAEARRQYGS